MIAVVDAVLALGAALVLRADRRRPDLRHAHAGVRPRAAKPVAFFTRTQTGALISRLNTDVIGAQQAFTTTMSAIVSNVISLVVVLIAMLALSWQITVVSLILLPVFVIPARLVGRRLQR